MGHVFLLQLEIILKDLESIAEQHKKEASAMTEEDWITIGDKKLREGMAIGISDAVAKIRSMLDRLKVN